MNDKIDVLAVMDADIALRRSIYDEGRGTKPMARTEQNLHNLACAIEARAAIAELIEAAVLIEESLPDDNRLAAHLRAAVARVGGA